MILVWLRQDLRIHDNPGLFEASLSGEPVSLLYWWDTESDKKAWSLGGASRWWLHHSLAKLSASFEKRYGARLELFVGPPQEFKKALVTWKKERELRAVFWNRCYEPAAIARDTALKSELKAQGIDAQSFKALVLREPWELKTQQGKPYQVYTPFWRNWRSSLEDLEERPEPSNLVTPREPLTTTKLADLPLLDSRDWASAFPEAWQPGEAGALVNLDYCVEHLSSGRYADQRNTPSLRGTSRLSPHFHFGEVSPKRVWNAVSKSRGGEAKNETYLKEIVWREFAYHLIYHFPHTSDRALRSEYDRFPWSQNAKALKAWTRGQTGYPIVDAGMRELWSTGWMHNRVRMIVSSFLVKHLRLHWLEGARWFWDTLVDADLAANTLGWQWSAGSGADAAPYFRIFNPVLQGEKFDPDGDYVKKWVPELGKLPAAVIHKPWELSPLEQASLGVRLGRDYPEPLVDHATARAEALRVLEEFRKLSKT